MHPDRLIIRTPALIILAALLVATFALSACGDDDTPSEEAQRDTRTTERTETDRRNGEAAEREARAIAEELKELQRDVADSGRKLVEGSSEERDAAERELRAQERRAQRLAERAERELGPDATTARAELRDAARQTERGVADLRRFADDRREEGLARANERLEAAEASLRSVADSLREDAPEEDVREALEKLRERVPDIPMP